MKLMRYLALVFIDVFGITHPSIEARDRAAKYISFLMIALLWSFALSFSWPFMSCAREACKA
jgi:hypothetical protein